MRIAAAASLWLTFGCAAGNDPSNEIALCSEGLVAAGNGCRPADAALRPHVAAVRMGPLRLSGAVDRPLRIDHPVAASLQLELLSAPLRTSVAVSAHSPSRKQSCILGLLPVDATAQLAGSGPRKLALQAQWPVPVACAALVGAPDLHIATTFDPQQVCYVPARDDRPAGASTASAATTGATIDQSAACGGMGRVLRGDGCGVATIADSNGSDVILRDLALVSSVAVVEYLGERPKPVQARAAKVTRNADGTTKTGVEVDAVDPDELAPTLDQGPLVTASAALVLGGSKAGAPASAAIDLAIRPAGSGDVWQAIEHHAVDAPDGQTAQAAAVRVVGGSDIAKGASVTLQARLADAVRKRITTGDWAKAALFELRVCAQTTEVEAGLDSDAKANNCASSHFVVARVRKDYGIHRYREAGAANANANAGTSDYLEMGKTKLYPIAAGGMLSTRVFRGGYREVMDGHVRLGAKAWANLLFFLTIETTHVLEAGAYHDTAPAASDYVSGYLTILSLLTLDLDKYTVAENFKFALNAAVDTKKSKNEFGGTANLGPLVDALNFVAKQASSDGLKWCFFDVVCVEPPMQIPGSLKLGLALAKSTTVPKCELVNGIGCYEQQGTQSGTFWKNAAACAAIAATVPSDHEKAAGAAGLRKIANKWQTPFYMGLYRPGKDYHYLMSKVFFDNGWKPYGTDLKSSTPTNWAFLDASLEPENGACAAVAPDETAATYSTDYTGPLVSQAVKTKPWLALDAAKSHVGCEAKLPYVCEYPVDNDKVMYESSEAYLQQTGQVVIDGTVSYTKTLFNLKGSVGLDGYVMKATWAATAGLRWNAVANTAKKWRTKGNAFADIKVVGKIGEFSLFGEGCVLLGLGEICILDICTPSFGHWECLKVSWGGLTSFLATAETSMGFTLDFQPFDVQQQ